MGAGPSGGGHTERGDRPGASGPPGPRVLRAAALVVALAMAAILLWWGFGRLTAEGRRLAVRHADVAAVEPGPGAADRAAADSGGAADPGMPPDSGAAVQEHAARELRVVTWNLAHGRGDDTTGWLANWTGGRRDVRAERLHRVATALRRADADVVVLNEVDFRSLWSGGLDQAEVLARAAGYPTWVEQRNFDLRLPFATFAFGNAVLSRLPVEDVRWLDLPVRSRLESLLAGAKASATVRVRTPRGAVTVVPIHLDFRTGPVRRAAVEVLDSVRDREPGPLVLAGDFNAAPPGWSGTQGPTVLGDLLDRGWRSPRAETGADRAEATWPTRAPRRALDWILVEPPLEVVEARVLDGTGALSDHAPVLSVVRLPAVAFHRSGPPHDSLPASSSASRASRLR